MKRKYELKQRAQRQAETRQRIVDATVDLAHVRRPARTTISAIAERAGVERHTVYAHFPDEHDALRRLRAALAGSAPVPDLGRWLELDDPEARLRRCCTDVYAWYERVERDLASLTSRRGRPGAHGRARRDRRGCASSLGTPSRDGWPRRKAVRAAIGHALEFETWRSLDRAHAAAGVDASWPSERRRIRPWPSAATAG